MKNKYDRIIIEGFKRGFYTMWAIVLDLIKGVFRWVTYRNRFEKKIDSVLNNQAQHEKRLLRLELCDAIRRNDRTVVHNLYDEYKEIGGNSYMDELYKNYCKNKRSKKC